MLDEMNCGFVVSDKRKAIWDIQLELLSEIDRICKKYDLKYYAINGTLLGAVRHNGFIPWDDDMDIMMPREDYELFKNVVEEEVQKPVYFQDGLSQDKYYRLYGRLRNANTTAVSWMDMNGLDVNGIFIDIFAIDGYCDKTYYGKIIHKKVIKLMDNLSTVFVYKESSAPFLKKIIGRSLMKCICLFYPFDSFKRKTDIIQQKFKFNECNKVFIMTHSKALVFEKEWLNKVLYLNFENTKIPVPGAYDNLLTIEYGDYMKVPKKEDRGNHHSILFDPYKPFSEYYGSIEKEQFNQMINNY